MLTELPAMTKNRIIILALLSWSIVYQFFELNYNFLFYIMPLVIGYYFLWKFDDVDFVAQDNKKSQVHKLGPEIKPHDILKPKWEDTNNLHDLRKKESETKW